jgi:hypothetical protein
MKREPRETCVITAIAPFLLAVTMATAPAAAQQVTGELGAPSATPKEAFPKGKAAAKMALQLDPGSRRSPHAVGGSIVAS